MRGQSKLQETYLTEIFNNYPLPWKMVHNIPTDAMGREIKFVDERVINAIIKGYSAVLD